MCVWVGFREIQSQFWTVMTIHDGGCVSSVFKFILGRAL